MPSQFQFACPSLGLGTGSWDSPQPIRQDPRCAGLGGTTEAWAMGASKLQRL